MILSFATETVEVLRPAVVHQWGQDVVDWADLTAHTVEGCAIYGLSGIETVDGVDVTSGLLQVFMPPEADVKPTDRIRTRGHVWEMVGAPILQKSPLGTVSHLAITLRYWEGKK